MPDCHSCGGSTDVPERFCRWCGARLEFPTPARPSGGSSANAARVRPRKSRRAAIAVTLIAVLTLAVALAGVWPRPAPATLPTAKVLLDVEGKIVRDGKRVIVISPMGDGERRYTSFRLEWSASAPLRLEVGILEAPVMLLSMGGSSSCGNLEAAQHSGDRIVRADESSRNVWFIWGDGTLDGEDTRIDQLTVTAYLV